MLSIPNPEAALLAWDTNIREQDYRRGQYKAGCNNFNLGTRNKQRVQSETLMNSHFEYFKSIIIRSAQQDVIS